MTIIFIIILVNNAVESAPLFPETDWGSINILSELTFLFFFMCYVCKFLSITYIVNTGPTSRNSFLSSAYVVSPGPTSRKFCFSVCFFSFCILFPSFYLGLGPGFWQWFWHTVFSGHSHRQCRSLA